MNIDATDLKILAELVQNSKSSFAEIGRKLRLHPNVIAYRINKLERTGVITEYTANLDLEKIGLPEQIYIGASFPQASERDEVLEQIETIPQTVKVVSSLGEPESIVFLVGKNKADVEKIMAKIRNLNVRIEYTGSIIRTSQDGRLGNFLRMMAREIEDTASLGQNNGDMIGSQGG
jgi:Lrp/AsnC family leucine-responsive transcriptional regulator